MESSIAVASKRGAGIGKSLMQEAMRYCEENYPHQDIQLAAQCYLENFYQKFGFNIISEPYDEDGIDHIDMAFKYKVDALR